MNSNSKYEILPHSTMQHNGFTLYRIRAKVNFSDVKAGDVGGWIDETSVLDYGDCWLYGESKLFNHSFLGRDAKVCNSDLENSTVTESASVCESFLFRSRVCGSAVIKNSSIYDSEVCGQATVCEDSRVDDCKIGDRAKIHKGADVHRANVLGKSMVFGDGGCCVDCDIDWPSVRVTLSENAKVGGRFFCESLPVNDGIVSWFPCTDRIVRFHLSGPLNITGTADDLRKCCDFFPIDEQTKRSFRSVIFSMDRMTSELFD